MANQVTLFGNLGQDPELKYTPSGKAVTSLSLATTKVWYGKDGKKNDETQWHRVILWEKQAETAAKYLTKGSKLLIIGEITYRTWEDDKGTKHYITEIVGKNMEFGGGAQQQQGGQQQARPPQQQQQARSQQQQARPQQQAQQPSGMGNLDDIPF